MKPNGELADADAGFVTCYCPHGVTATNAAGSRAACKAFYDLGTPITLARLGSPGQAVRPGLARGLARLRPRAQFHRRAGARGVARPARSEAGRSSLWQRQSWSASAGRAGGPLPRRSVFGTYAGDRQAALDELFVDSARRLPASGSSSLARSTRMTSRRAPTSSSSVTSRPPSISGRFFSSSRLTLNVTREPMAAMDIALPDGCSRAAACGCPVLRMLRKASRPFTNRPRRS